MVIEKIISELNMAFSELPLRFKIMFFVSLIAGPFFLIKSYVKKGKFQEINLLAGLIFLFLFITISLIIFSATVG